MKNTKQKKITKKKIIYAVIIVVIITFLVSVAFGVHNYRRKANFEKRWACKHIAYWCVGYYREDRPSFSDFNHCINAYTLMNCNLDWLYTDINKADWWYGINW